MIISRKRIERVGIYIDRAHNVPSTNIFTFKRVLYGQVEMFIIHETILTGQPPLYISAFDFTQTGSVGMYAVAYDRV